MEMACSRYHFLDICFLVRMAGHISMTIFPIHRLQALVRCAYVAFMGYHLVFWFGRLNVAGVSIIYQ
jgi:hypothetical protein